MFAFRNVLALLPLALSAVNATSNKGACPSGYKEFVDFSNATIPDVHAKDVWRYVGDFCNVTWQAFDLINTTGKCNTIGQTRTFLAAEVIVFSERLDFDIGSYANPSSNEVVFGQGWTAINIPPLPGVDVQSTEELLTVSPGAKGGAYISWQVIGCANDSATAAATFRGAHQGALNGTIAHFA